MHYDIVAKVLTEKCRGEILRHLPGLSVAEISLPEQLPQETVSLRRSDFPIPVTDESGGRQLVLPEIQSRRERDIPLRLSDYHSRYLLRYDVVKVITCALLLRPSADAAALYEDDKREANASLLSPES